MTALKPKKTSLVEFTARYCNNDEACYDFFWNSRYPNGFVCEKCGCTHYRKIRRHNVTECTECGHQHYLFAGTIFQDNKLPLYKLLLGLFLFFSNNKGISAIEMRSYLDVNYKTALLLCRKCRILMKESSNIWKLDASVNIKPYFEKSVVMSKDRVLNTDGKTTYNCLKEKLTVYNEHIDYSEKNHRLYWLNIVIGNIQNQITGIYHGVAKRDMPLFLAEQEYRFNHRYTGKEMMNKICSYITRSYPCPKRAIIRALDAAQPCFTSACV